ncbi:hypothetical protein C0Q44_27870 [Paenibacillus sp. PCH8]|uniref:S16 family serine protease n=1 Tax=Paenibacillus sp. PCH8 TaxID=2066524 RepID=UPI000CFA3D62|nr:S16 family serine protease [Paenibacillus sp. PCH8]PQP80237.1 hypothetical protein C0Q44_27870 [Paenibacillus sp. PCH8]
MNSEVVKPIDRKMRKRIFLSTIVILVVVLVIPSLIKIELRTYELPGKLDSAQELFRNKTQSFIYIPGVYEQRVSRLSDYLILKIRYRGLLQEFEQPKQQQETPYVSPEDPPGRLEYVDTEELRDSQLFVAIPAYIAGSNEADRPIQYGFEFEITGIPSEETEDLLNSTIVTIDGSSPTLERVEQILASKALHRIEGRSYDGKTIFLDTSLYNTTVSAHYTIKELWKFSDLMRFDLANIEGNSGGAATAYQVMLKQQGRPNEHGEFVITGAIEVEGDITSVGGVKAKTYLAIKNSIPVMFVPKGINYTEAIEMKSLMKSNIDIVPIQKLGDIEAYWK